MTDTEIIIEIAKLDGLASYSFPRGHPQYGTTGCYINKFGGVSEMPYYLNSRDAIIPVIEKHITNPDIEHTFNYALYDSLPKEDWDKNAMTYVMAVKATARQLSVALLKTSGKWKE